LDGIKMAGELFLMHPFSQLLKKHGPEIGMFFPCPPPRGRGLDRKTSKQASFITHVAF